MISSISQVINRAKFLLSELCPHIKVVELFPSGSTEFPLKAPTVSVGIKTAQLPYGEGAFRGKDDFGNSYYGITALVTLGLNICVPKSQSGYDCYATFDMVAAACNEIQDFNVVSLSMGEIHYNRSMGALVMPAEITLTAEFESEKSDGIGDIVG